MGDDDENWMAGMGMGCDDDDESVAAQQELADKRGFTGAELDACVKVLTALSSDLEAFRAEVTLKPLRAEAEQQTIADAKLESFLASYLAAAQSA